MAWAAGLGVWLGLVVLGMAMMFRYEALSGPNVVIAPQWPADSAMRVSPRDFTLVLLVHPHCPCSRASVSELDRLLARAGGRLVTYVLFVRPDGVPDGWEHTRLWDRVAAMPGVHPIRDEDGVEAGRFGAVTSGQTLLYDAGVLVFAGGITATRGHEGDSDGRTAILDLLRGRRARPTTPVYGCSLVGDPAPRPGATERDAL